MEYKKIGIFLISVFGIIILFFGCEKDDKIKKKKITYTKTEVTLEDAMIPVKATLGDIKMYYVSKGKEGKKDVPTVIAFDTQSKIKSELSIIFSEKERILALDYSTNKRLIILTFLEDRFYLYSYENESTELWKNDITGNLLDKDADSSFFIETDEEGRIYLLNGLYCICVWNEQGNFQFSLQNSNWMKGISCINGEIWVYVKDSQGAFLQELNIEKQQWEELEYKNIPRVTDCIGCIFRESDDGNLIINAGSGLSLYNIKKETEQPILDWIEYGINTENICDWKEQEKLFWCVISEDERGKFVALSPAEDVEISEKEIITMNDNGTHGFIEQSVSKFNQQSEKYTIQLVEGKGNAAQSVDLRDVEILAGNGTDIICMPSEKQYRKYANKGILENLYNYIDKDEDMTRDDFLSNIFRAYEQNGKIYGIPPSFDIVTLTAPTKYVGNELGVSTDEFKRMTENLPENMKLSPIFINKKIVFRYLLTYTYPQFIDFENYTCDFESDEFISWLMFIDSIKLEESINDFSQYKLSDYPPQNYLLNLNRVRDEGAYQESKILSGEEEMTFIGYPGKNDCGSLIGNATAVGIWSESSNKEGAWEFIKFLLSEEQQDSLRKREVIAFPVRNSSIEKNFAKAMVPEYKIDENGNQKEIPKGEVTLWTGDTQYYYVATEEDIKKMRELITSVEMIYSGNGYNEDLERIILEEVTAFYEGDKLAEEVAALIQNRVKLFLNEIK